MEFNKPSIKINRTTSKNKEKHFALNNEFRFYPDREETNLACRNFRVITYICMRTFRLESPNFRWIGIQNTSAWFIGSPPLLSRRQIFVLQTKLNGPAVMNIILTVHLRISHVNKHIRAIENHLVFQFNSYAHTCFPASKLAFSFTYVSEAEKLMNMCNVPCKQSPYCIKVSPSITPANFNYFAEQIFYNFLNKGR